MEVFSWRKYSGLLFVFVRMLLEAFWKTNYFYLMRYRFLHLGPLIIGALFIMCKPLRSKSILAVPSAEENPTKTAKIALGKTF